MPPLNPLGMSHRTVNVVKDIHGQVVLEVGAEEAIVHDAKNQTYTKYRTNDNIQLVCGSVYNPMMSIGANPVMLLSVCEVCRHPPWSWFHHETATHGLCNSAAGHGCHECGLFVCPRHARQGKDRMWRCPSCARTHAIKRFFRPIFYARVED
jgi:hypothetical protein